MNNEEIFNNKDYYHFVAEYEGLYNEKNIIPNVSVTIINYKYAILSIKVDLIDDVGDTKFLENLVNDNSNSDFKITYIDPPKVYTLQEISAIEASNVDTLQANLSLNLTGKGVVVGIIDTGIDYLNEEFINDDGTSRINAIWDQTINSNSTEVPLGTIYRKEDINKAIAAYRVGGNPYEIVGSRDENGHGTNMAGIVGAKGRNTELKGIAPECEFIIVKLIEVVTFKHTVSYSSDTEIFSSSFIFLAIEFLKEYLLKSKKPVVILLPLSSNSGNHKGQGIIDYYIESISSNIGIVVVTGTGNQGASDTHTSGRIDARGDNQIVEMIVGEGQKNFYIDIWIDLPNIATISLISPSGESTGDIPVILKSDKKYIFVFEKTKIRFYYYLPEQQSGEELIRVYFYDVVPGVWSIKIDVEQGQNVQYNLWLMQKELLAPGTRFASSDPYGTITSPADSDFVIAVAAYNQNNNNILAYSGNAFRREELNTIDFAAGGVNTKTVGLNNKVDIINGTSLAAAIGAGACVLLMQWGIVDGNYSNIYIQSIRTFLRRATDKRIGDKYPNSKLGYGIINFYKIFESMI